jgi:hypothetical protein
MLFAITFCRYLPEPGGKMTISAGTAGVIGRTGGNLALGHAMQRCNMTRRNAYHQPRIGDFHQHNPLALTDR